MTIEDVIGWKQPLLPTRYVVMIHTDGESWEPIRIFFDEITAKDWCKALNDTWKGYPHYDDDDDYRQEFWEILDKLCDAPLHRIDRDEEWHVTVLKVEGH